MLSPSLKEQVAIEIFTNTVKKNLPLKTAIKNMVKKRIQNPAK